jgi:rod shape-determining protein MreC
MLKRPHYIALSLVVFLVLAVLNLPSRTATQFKLALSSLFLPLFGLASSVHSLSEQAGNSLTPRRVLLTELERLRRENSQCRVRQTQVAEVFRDNDRLRRALRLQQQIPFKLQFARVVLRDPANWWRTVQIDVGQRDGIVTDLPVLTLDGQLAGRVTQVGSRASRVALVGDPFCRVSAVVEDGKARDYGVIYSGLGGVLDGSLVDLTYVNRPTASKPGQPVLTSGLGEFFPKGIPIGHIVDTNSVGLGLYMEARVKLGANLDSLEEVWVVLP